MVPWLVGSLLALAGNPWDWMVTGNHKRPQNYHPMVWGHKMYLLPAEGLQLFIISMFKQNKLKYPTFGYEKYYAPKMQPVFDLLLTMIIFQRVPSILKHVLISLWHFEDNKTYSWIILYYLYSCNRNHICIHIWIASSEPVDVLTALATNIYIRFAVFLSLWMSSDQHLLIRKYYTKWPISLITHSIGRVKC